MELGISAQPQKYFATDRKHEKILSEKQSPEKEPSLVTINLVKLKLDIKVMKN